MTDQTPEVPSLNRREMLLRSAASMLSVLVRPTGLDCDFPFHDGAPAVDYHAHIGDGLTVDQVIVIGKRRGLKFGVLQHAGTRGHGYAVSDDQELNAWVDSLSGKPVFKGIEAEGTDWRPAFSRQALARLDYVQGDCLGMPGPSGEPMRMYEPSFRVDNVQAFMDRYVDFHVQRITTEPLDILVVPTALPATLQADYDRLWTEARTRAVVDAAIKFNVALEIDCQFRVPSLRFLQTAKSAGVVLAFGSNFQTPEKVGDISYCVDCYKSLGLTPKQFFCPAAPGMRAVDRR